MVDRYIQIGGRFAIPERELSYEFSRSSGPGGQHVNVTDSAVTLRFDVLGSTSLPDDVRIRLLAAAGSHVSSRGVLTLRCEKFRQQLRNRYAVREQFIALLMKVALPPATRRHTSVPRVEREARLELKKRVSLTKLRRRRPRADDED